ncbi:AAA family ATPase [Desulfosediminicola flagellatus]|uniref:AAA family ATPase n=1 Tax=Desulfosediminicola flagellatus TaxID=2569541 RepID=UPI0010AC212D|nr:AAA family ATPase [Desulfosediminicola flagellatus]
MSRYCGEHEIGKILEAAEYWRQSAFLSDGSVFSKKVLWNLKSFEALEKFFINKLDSGDGNFYDKLYGQLEPTGPEVKQLAAEILWLMLLCPSNITAQTKQDGIKKIWSWGEEELPDQAQWLFNDTVLHGVGSAGTAYNTNRWREMVFVIRVLLSFKKLDHHLREALLADHIKFAEWLELIPECGARQFRHMLLFLLFPDYFERIFGGTDRQQIVMKFRNKAKAQVKKLSALDIDKVLSAIRQEQEKSFERKELDFYLPPLQQLWSEERNLSWLFTWNPANWQWDTLAQDREMTHKGKTVTHSWSCANKSAQIGDKAYLVRTGTEPRGIVAVGNIVSEAYEEFHYDEQKAAEGKKRWCVDISFSRIQDPSVGDKYISAKELAEIDADNQHWFPQSSGIEIKTRSAALLQQLWHERIEKGQSGMDGGAFEMVAIKDPVNLILYGPPGTGKTYHLNKLANQYTSKQQSIGYEVWLSQQVAGESWFNVTFAVLYELDGAASVSDILAHKFVQLKVKANVRTRNVRQTLWSVLQTHAREDSETVKYNKRTAPLVFDKDENSRFLLVGDWQEECTELIDMVKMWKQGPDEKVTEQRYDFITFHQAYSYEDFVEGIRPVQDEENGEGLTYPVVAGIFRRICQRAQFDPAQRYALFIDEINRGNIAKIFGELITLIEGDKRTIYAVDGTLQSGMELTLPYSGDKFGVPKNLDIYGTMNTADRSIALLDTALRRRFRFKELMPNPAVINGSRGDGYIEDGEGGVINLRAMLTVMNRRIRFLLNRDLMLGHAYFWNIRDFEGLKDLLLNQIIPLLQEYFYEDWHRIQLVLRDVGPDGSKLEPQIICHEELKEIEVLGFDHDDYEDIIEYSVSKAEDISPDAIRKIYEEGS